ncbi:hypothetical protein ACU4HD_11025 [Cupriavidus basilensis]
MLIPEENVKDLADIPDNVKNSIEIVSRCAGSTRCWNSRSMRKPEPLPEEEAKPAPAECDDGSRKGIADTIAVEVEQDAGMFGPFFLRRLQRVATFFA